MSRFSLLSFCMLLFSFGTSYAQSCDGGTVSTTGGDTSVYTCPGDGNDDIVMFSHVTASTDNYTYVVTDDQNIILGNPPSNSQNFEGAGVGVCRVWGLSYTGNLTITPGQDAAAVALSDDCFDLSDNFIEVVRDNPDGGTVATTDGETTVYTCPGDNVADVVSFMHTNNSNTLYTYIITDDQNNILGNPPGNSLDFEGAGVGDCRVWGLAYTGNLTFSMGQNAAMISLSDDCFDLSSNFITVVRDMPDGGTVAMPSGATMRYTCPGDGNADVVMFTHTTTSNAAYTYLITDDQNNILGNPPGNSLDFEGAGVGVCRVWGLSYTGNLTFSMGQDAAAINLSDDCFDLSDNFITVVRDNPDGGTVATTDGETTVYTCPGDNVADVVSFMHTNNSNTLYTYIITDDQNNILGNPPGNSLDFEGAGVGDCRVWGLAYTGNLTFSMGQNAAAINLSDDCFDLSSNFITVVRDMPDGGTVATLDGETSVYTCPGDGNDDIVSFMHTTTSNAAYTYVITDDQNIILGNPPANSQNFEGAGVGVCRVWGLSYTGTLTITAGQDAAAVALSDDCFDLSDNFIEVVRDNPDGGTVATTDGETTVYTCPGDNVADVVSFMHTNNSNSLYTYIITDDQNNILGNPPGNSLDFEGAGVGDCRVWGLAYTGNLTFSMGQNAAMISLSDDCFDLSDNFITVVRDMPDGGTVAMPSGATVRYTCPGDGNADVVMFTHTTTSNAAYTYVITDDQNIILGNPPGNSLDFEGAGLGVCRVWGLSYTGNLTITLGQDAAAVALSDDCFDLSDNFIEVNRTTPDGGTVSSSNGTTFGVCATSSNAIFDVSHTTTTPGFSYWYIITDNNSNILGWSTTPTIDFSGAPAGVCRVYGWSYQGLPDPIVGDHISTLDDDLCEDISDNFITIYRQNPDGGMVNTPYGTSFVVCANTGNASFPVSHTTTADFLSYWYIITDDQSNILGWSTTPMVDLSGAPAGTCRVYGWSYRGLPDPVIGDHISSLNDDQCEDISSNFIEVRRSADCVLDFTLIDAQADTPIGPLQDGDVIDLANLPTDRLNVQANIFGSGVESVVFGLNNDPSFGVRNNAPYALAGATPAGNFFQWIPAPGVYTITATPFSGNAGAGIDGAPASITFTVIETPPTLDVTGFVLVNALTDQDIAPLSDGDVIDLSVIGTDKLNIRANTNGADVESVVFGLNGNPGFGTRNREPYALGGATPAGSYFNMMFAPGSFMVSATAYSGNGGTGLAGPTSTINFSVVSSSRESLTSMGSGLHLYPNPGRNRLNLMLEDGQTGDVDVTMMNAQGQIIHQEAFSTIATHWEMKLETGHLPAGMYLIRVTNAQEIISKRWIKE